MKKANEVMEVVNATIEHANRRLAEITVEGFPFAFDEVRMTADMDTIGIYVHSGMTSVGAIKHLEVSDADVVRKVKETIWTAVDDIKIAVGRRGSLKREAQELADKAVANEKAASALLAAGLSVDLLSNNVNADAAKAITDAARKAVAKANVGIFMASGKAVPLKEAKMFVSAFSNGIVVTAGGKPCLVTRFPKILNNREIERTIKFIKSDIAALNSSRRHYLERVRLNAEREESMRSEAMELDGVYAHAAAM